MKTVKDVQSRSLVTEKWHVEHEPCNYIRKEQQSRHDSQECYYREKYTSTTSVPRENEEFMALQAKEKYNKGLRILKTTQAWQ